MSSLIHSDETNADWLEFTISDTTEPCIFLYRQKLTTLDLFIWTLSWRTSDK